MSLKQSQDPTNQTICLLFIYGSLITGTPQPLINRIIKRQCRTICNAYVHARLYDFGRYPGIIHSHNHKEKVYGRLLQFRKPALLQLIDNYENYYQACPQNSEFVRRCIQVYPLTVRTAPQRAWCYFYNGCCRLSPRIKSGKYNKT